MSSAQIKSVQCLSPAGLHDMVYKEWGDPRNAKVLICVHGLTRVSDDFDALAQAMSDEYRVVCPDVVGRGRSGRLRNPALYQVPQYVSDMVSLIAKVQANSDTNKVHWFGTSMGGLIGMGLAAQKDTPITKLILNDIGPVIDAVAIQRICQYVGQEVIFPDYAQALQYIREISVTFGPHSDEQWDKLARSVLRQQADGSWTRSHDLGIAQSFASMTTDSAKQGEAILWAMYDAITCPTLLVRGAESDLLSKSTAQAMSERGPKACLIEIAGVGHAPTFFHADQIALAREFLLSN